jgi:serine/threonine protein kinase
MRAVNAERGPLSPGERLLKYEIRGLLGRGGHAFVYHGYDPFLDRSVAIKIIPNPTDRDRDLRRRAQLEARVLCRLRHPNVVQVMDAGVTESGFVYIIMERLEGRTLRDVLLDVRLLTVQEALVIGAHIAEGTQAAHDENAVHRDLKPENVFIQVQNAAKVLDFGIAKFVGEAPMTTQKDLLHGTLLYMSPEHLQGASATARSDIFSLGVLLYEALSGRPPALLGIAEPTLQTLAWAQIHRMPPPLDELTGTVPRHVARLVQRMIAKDPVDRFPSMQEVAALLRSGLARVVSESPSGLPGARELWKRPLRKATDAKLDVPSLPATTVAARGESIVAQLEAETKRDRRVSPMEEAAPQRTELLEVVVPPEIATRTLPPETSFKVRQTETQSDEIPFPDTTSALSSRIQVANQPASGSFPVRQRSVAALGLGVAALGVLVVGGVRSTRAPASASSARTGVALAPAPSPQHDTHVVAVPAAMAAASADVRAAVPQPVATRAAAEAAPALAVSRPSPLPLRVASNRRATPATRSAAAAAPRPLFGADDL